MYYKIVNGAILIDAKTILEEINIEIKEKDHIGVVGRNGSGKTTLLKTLIDNEYLSEGLGDTKLNIIKNGNFKIGYLEQVTFSDDTITLLEEILKVYEPLIKLEKKIAKLEQELKEGASTKTINEYEKAQEEYKLNGGYSYKKEYLTALKTFGFSNKIDIPLKNFSGGEKTKIAFLKLLLAKPDLLILDEPTNHLDMEAILWLEEYLNNYQASFIIVSHDRMFLDKTINKIIEIEYGATTTYYGNYTKYVETKKLNYEKALKDYERNEKEIKRLQAIADRFRYKPSKARMALSKLKQIERMPKLVKPKASNEKTFSIKNITIPSSSSDILVVNHLKIGYESILNEVTFTLNKKERLGIIGTNGIGKSTLLETLVNNIPPKGGTFVYGSGVKIGYFNQQLNSLDSKNTIYEEIKNNTSLNDFETRSILASFMFYENDITKKINVLSGGEKVLLSLCKIIINKPNLLILDEPTNHLDILGKEKLSQILKEYSGTIIFVTHDRYFLKELATSILAFNQDKVEHYQLNYNEYLEKNKTLNKKDNKDNFPKKEKIKSKPDSKNIGKNILKLEKMISKKESDIKLLKDKIYKPEIYSNYEELKNIKEEINKQEQELNNLMNLWEKEMSNLNTCK